MSLAVDALMDTLNHAELDAEDWQEFARRVQAKADAMADEVDDEEQKFPVGSRVVWTDPDDYEDSHGTITRFMAEDDVYLVEFDGADGIQTPTYGYELRAG